jgi:superfamily II DNA helicase RecQ
MPRKVGTTQVTSAEAGGPARGFLGRYADTDRQGQVRRAVDEVAFRLFGFPEVQPFQHRILERVLCGESTLAIAAMGSGKSECFILPAMLVSGVTIAISPLKALMTDQYERRIRDRFGLDHLST